MAKEANDMRTQVEVICADQMVPKDHLLRKIDRAVDFTYIEELTKALYYHDNGRPGENPIVLFKMVMIQHLYGIPGTVLV